MNDLVQRAERVVRHSRRFFLRLCAFCDRPVGLATTPATDVRACEHDGVLLRLARRRVLTLGAPSDCDPDPDRPTPRRTGRVRRRAALRSSAVAA